MKYMGSKRAMLKNGLGELLLQEATKANRVFDPFCGSSSALAGVRRKQHAVVGVFRPCRCSPKEARRGRCFLPPTTRTKTTFLT